MTELWKTVENYPNYEVSNTGKVRNVKTNKVLKPGLTNVGYHVVCLSNNGKTQTFGVHILVARAFIENTCPDIRKEVHHVDGNKINNNAYNLMWVTREENMNYGSSGSSVYINYILNRTRQLLNDYHDYITSDEDAKEIMVWINDAVFTKAFSKQNHIEYR